VPPYSRYSSRAQDIYPEITRGGRVRDNEDVRDRDNGAERTGLLAHPALPSSCLTRGDGAPQGPDVIIVVRGPAGSSAHAPRRGRPTPTAASVLVSSVSNASSSKPTPVNQARIGGVRIADAPRRCHDGWHHGAWLPTNTIVL
jgi:hypothetical protein